MQEACSDMPDDIAREAHSAFSMMESAAGFW